VPELDRPNILLILFDSLSAIDSGLLNTPTSSTRLAGLSAKSVLFTSAYTPCPESSPARASLLTGLDPCVHGLWTNGVKLPPRERTFPEVLAQVGYVNWLVGRRQLAGVASWTTEHPRPDEFAEVEWAHGPLHRSRQNAYLMWLSERAPERYAQIFASQADPDKTTIPPEQREAVADLPDDLSFNHWIGERIGDLISTHPRDQPFLAIAGFSVGSSMGAQPAIDHDGETLNERALQQADAALDRILEELAECSGLEETVILVTAGRGNNAPGTPDDAMRERSIRVPLLMRVVGGTPRIVDAPVSLIDIAPTILDIAGLPHQPRMQGRSLLGILNGTEEPRGWIMSRLRRGSPGQDRHWQTALRANTMKLIVNHGNTLCGIPASYELFDLDADPDERRDLACNPAYAADLEDMVDMMIDARCTLEDRTEPRIAEF